MVHRRHGRLGFWAQSSLMVVAAVLAASCTPLRPWEADRGWGPAPPPPPARNLEREEASRGDRAWELYQWVRRENRKLQWDECLARVAHRRARNMALSGRFDHKDPRTGKNPVWSLVWECSRYQLAGENLVRGEAPPLEMHRALMDSRTHRENLLNPDFQLVGIGCYRNVCVQLFAGF